MKKITKRDGRVVPFDERKIYIAIAQAFESCGKHNNVRVEELTDKVVEQLNDIFKRKTPSVEQIQDVVENVLISENEKEVAKSYILYRANRTKKREANTSLMKVLEDITFQTAADNNVKRENANIDGDTAMGTMLKYGSESAKEFYRTHVLELRFAEAHKNGDIHIHDLDFYTLTMTCCQIDLIKLFKGGFSTGNGYLREPNSIRSYASLCAIAIQANQNDQHGGQSIPNFDYAMGLGVRKTYTKILKTNLAKIFGLFDDKFTLDFAKTLVTNVEQIHECRMVNKDFEKVLKDEIAKEYKGDNLDTLFDKVLSYSLKETREETLQAMEALVHNLNTMHSRAGAQVPFSSLNYGTDTSEEGRMAIDCLLDATMRGLGKGETPIFPIQIFKVKSGINYNPGEPNYDLYKKAIKCSGLRLFPNFSFIDAPMNIPFYKEGDYNTEVAYMGCRTRVMSNVDKEHEQVCGRGNLSFTSINLPRLGIEAKGNLDVFFKSLDTMMDLVKDQLLERYNIQYHKKVYNFPFLYGQHIWLGSDDLKDDDEVGPTLIHGTLTVGFIGLAECLKALIGKHHGESSEAQELGLKIIRRMREKTDEYTKQYNLNFSLIATPAEGLSGRFTKIDQKKYGILPGITDHEFYTNSFHIPVYYKIGIYDKIHLEAPYNYLTNGGHITYVEVDGDIAKNEEAFEKIVRCMHDEGIGYGSINHPIDRDPVCGYNGIIDNVCPGCGRHEDDVKFERIRRITGYLVGTLDRFNDGKRAEVESRVKHLEKANLEDLQ